MIWGSQVSKMIFIGGIFPEEKAEFLTQTEGACDVPADTLQKNIIKGIEKNTGEHLTVFNLYFIHDSLRRIKRVQPYTWKGEMGGTNYNLPYIRLRGYSLISKSRAIQKYVGRWLSENNPNGKTKILVYSAYFPFLKGLSALKKKYDLEICLIVPDLPLYMGLRERKSLYNKLSLQTSAHLFNKYLPIVDSFVLLTEQMNEVVNPKGKPYAVMEGIASGLYVYKALQPTQHPRVVMYSGGMQKKYGIPTLLDAIRQVDVQDVEFRFYGKGDAVELVKACAETDSRIRYCGTLEIHSLHEEQQKSTLLINPRQNNETFTKYSFPSKNLEYMLSGRPTIAYKLDGMPQEYEEFLIMPKDDSVTALANCIQSVLQMSPLEQCEIGLKARKFVIEQKNYISQTKKILELLQ